MTQGIRPRMMADLRFTTADAHYLAEIWPRQHPQLGGHTQTHAFLNHPTRSEFYETVAAILQDLEDRQGLGAPDWSGLGLTLTFAGHGEDVAGGLVVMDGEIHPQELVDWLGQLAHQKGTGGLRVGLVLDSCFSGEFLLRFLEATRLSDAVLPEILFASSMFDEPAWEDPILGHGVGTYCLSISDHLSTGLMSQGVQRDNTYGPALTVASGFRGTALLTLGRQNAMQADYGDIRTTLGSVRFWDLDNGWRDFRDVRKELRRLRDEAKSLIDRLVTGHAAPPIRSNREVLDCRSHLDELVELQRKPSHSRPMDMPDDRIVSARFLEADPEIPQPWKTP